MVSFRLMLFALCKTGIVGLTLNRKITNSWHLEPRRCYLGMNPSPATSLLALACSSAQSVRSFTLTVTVPLPDPFRETMQYETLQTIVNLGLEKHYDCIRLAPRLKYLSKYSQRPLLLRLCQITKSFSNHE